MKRLMLTAMQSGAGKTVMTCALLAALRRRGLALRAYKCGPDYIDPMFHGRVLGIPCRNLDLFLQGKEAVRAAFYENKEEPAVRHVPSGYEAERTVRATLSGNKEKPAEPAAPSEREGELAVLEGAMGYYDGMAGTTKNSAWEIAAETGTPAVLVVRPQGVGISLAAQICGMLQFRAGGEEETSAREAKELLPHGKPARQKNGDTDKEGGKEDAAAAVCGSGIRGVLLTDCKASLYGYLKPILERETGLRVFGYLPPMKEAVLESRHLGLLTAEEIEDLTERVQRLAEQAEMTVDLDGLLQLADTGQAGTDVRFVPERVGKRRGVCRIAVARDRAFCFYYEDSFEALRRAGAELVFFSPLEDDALPEHIDGLYLGGGYPELHAAELAGNESLRAAICDSVRNGLPTVAECGGFLYLQQTLEDETGRAWPVCGALPGKGVRTERLQRFGYQWLRAEQDSLLFRAGERIPAHEFHYWDCTQNGSDLTAEKPDGRHWTCGYAKESLYAAFPHLHLGGELPLAERFAAACTAYRIRSESFVNRCGNKKEPN